MAMTACSAKVCSNSISLSEKLHPHVPKSIEIKEAVGRLTPEERLYILQRARVLSHYSKAVEEAVAGMK